jgi:mRNA interferase MazF
VVVSSNDYIESVTALVVVVPLTTADRGWSHHVRIAGAGTGLSQPSFAMTEQPRTIARERVVRVVGTAGAQALEDIRSWLSDFLSL